MHKTIEYIVNLRTERMGQEDPEVLAKFYTLYTNSGLVAPSTIRKLENFL